MTKLLHIDSSVLGDHSVTRQLSSAVVASLQAKSDVTVTYRDLGNAPLAHYSMINLAAAQGATLDAPAQRQEVADSQAALQEFLDADIVVLGAPMYNFTISSQLKAWIDRIVQAGKTFRYGAQGPEGLAGDKRVIIAISRGGVYADGSPAAGAEHAQSHLRAVFGFIGTQPEFVVAEGVRLSPEHRQKAIDAALHVVSSLKAA